MVNASYCITYFEVGTNSRAGDASVFRESTLNRSLESTELGVPGPRPLPFSSDPIPFFIVGDDAISTKAISSQAIPSKESGRYGFNGTGQEN